METLDSLNISDANHSYSPQKLHDLPEEIQLHIFSLLSASDLARLGATSHALKNTTADNLLWANLAWKDYGVDKKLFGYPAHRPRSVTPEDSSPSSFVRRNSLSRHNHTAFQEFVRSCPWTPQKYYTHVLARYGRFLGYFQSDFPFFTARFLICRVDYSSGGNIIGEEMEAINILPRSQMTTSFSLDNTLSLDHLEPRLVRSRAFEVLLSGQEVFAYCCGHPLAAPASGGARRRATVAERGNLSPEEVNPRHVCNLKDSGGGFLALEEQSHEAFGGHLWSEFDLFPFARPLNFPIPRSPPNSITGLWPFSHQSRSLPLQRGAHSDLLVVSCHSTCTTAKLNILTFDEDNKISTNYRPRFSRIKGLGEPWIPRFRMSNGFDTSVPPESIISHPPRPGVWIGTYGGHGLEMLLLRYVAVSIPDDSQTRLPGDWPQTPSTTSWQLHAYKITGDINVPRGERSIRVFLQEPSLDGMVSLRQPNGPNNHEVNLNDAPELQPRWIREQKDLPKVPLQVFKAEGTVAHVGFRSQTDIPAWFVCSQDDEEFVVVWDQLGKLSRFRFAGLDG